jgi:hypothetical protein
MRNPKYYPMNDFVIATYLIYFDKRCLSGRREKLGYLLRGQTLRLFAFFVPLNLMKLLLFLCTLFFGVRSAAQTTANCNFRATPEIQQPSCAGAENGIIRIKVDNPLGLLLTYEWTKLLNIPLPLPLLVSNVAENLSAGDYRVVISSLTCRDTLKINLPEPALLQVLDTAICAINGVIDLKKQIRGGDGDYNVNANTLFGNAINCVNCADAVVNVDKTSIIEVEVKDGKGCQTKRSVNITVYDSLKAEIQTIDETCTENGAISVQGKGGSGNYTYTLANQDVPTTVNQERAVFSNLKSGNYPVQVLDRAGCRTEEQAFVRKNPQNTPVSLTVQDVSCYGGKDGAIAVIVQNPANSNITGYALNARTAPLQSQGIFRQLKADSTYTVYIYQGNDCYFKYAARVNEPDSMSLSANTSDANCPGAPDGAVELLAKGGNRGYQYSIDGVNYQSGNRFADLTADTYPAFARDQKGCTASSAFKINEPESPRIGTDVTASCPNTNSGSVVIIDMGGFFEGEYRFSLDSMRWQTSKIFNELAPGTYTIFVQDPKGCIFKVTAVVPEVKAPGVFFQTQPPSCPDSEDGSLTVQVTTNGTTADYFYSLDSVNFARQNVFQNLRAGTYRLFMRDSLNCVFSYPFTLTAPPVPIITLNTQNASCFDGKNGKVTIQTQGGRSPFTYALNGILFQSSPVFEGLGASTYVAIVRDANGCLFAQDVSVAQPARLLTNFTIVNETCGNNNGVLVCQPTGGILPYRYRWDVGDTTAVLTNLQAGNYRVSISDANNCLLVEGAKIENLPGPLVVGDLTNAPCHGMPKGAIELKVFGGAQPFAYLWSNGLRTEKIYNLTAGNYTVTVTDKNQCASVKTFNLYEPAPIDLQAQTGSSGGLWFINLICAGGAPPYTFQWSTGETTEDIFNLKPAEYSVTVTDQQGCSKVKTILIGTTAVQEPAWAKSVQIFPNPTTHDLHIRLQTLPVSETRLTLLDINGKIALPTHQMSGNAHTLHLTDLPKGVYLLRLEQAEGVLHRKIVLQ